MSAMGGGSSTHQVLGYIGLGLLFLVLLNLLVRKLGGWRRLFRWIKRETSRTVHAFTDPIRDRVRYRRRLRFLMRVLRNHAGWAQAEQAMTFAAAVDSAMVPYALALTKRRIGVLVAGSAVERPLPEPWEKDEDDPRLWWIPRDELAEYSLPSSHTPAQTPLLVCLGTGSEGRSAIMIDLLAGPPSLSVYGVPRTAKAVVQALAAQLDVRLPAGAVDVAEGIHDRHDGLRLDEALKRIGAWFVVGAAPVEQAVPSGVRLVSLGVARGSSRLVEATAERGLRLHGAASWLKIDPLPLARAVARSVRRLPPHDFETRGPARPATTTDDLDDLRVPAGVSGVSVLGPDQGRPIDRPTDASTPKATSWT
ncbi:hypothetical protein FB561_2011 [Kribbella amoyensis]|uniref:Uncharacterized protein n=1 Tax=Kribbella amoyensis TaxID=996641 RepID=A0A561BQ30_9ACTN|nr:hypothetical protein [Kribbella amoyensis]TWD80914.1 hypothetical protein FB561_2011 [Kribbella amoyensis]